MLKASAKWRQVLGRNMYSHHMINQQQGKYYAQANHQHALVGGHLDTTVTIHALPVHTGNVDEEGNDGQPVVKNEKVQKWLDVEYGRTEVKIGIKIQHIPTKHHRPGMRNQKINKVHA